MNDIKQIAQRLKGLREIFDIEATIRQTLLAAGWTQEPVFDDYVEEYLW